MHPLPRPPRARRPTAPLTRPRAARVDGHRIAWREAGAGPECVVLLHGLSGSGRWWRRNLAAFADGYRVLVPDVVGFGASRYTGALPDVPRLAALLAAWQCAAGVERAHWVGHSMGGHLAIHLAATAPERVGRLVLVDAAGLPRPLGMRPVARFVGGLAAPARWGDPRFLPVIAADALAAGPRTVLTALRNLLRDDVRPLLARIAAPTLILWGERDAIVPPEHGRELRRAIPGARLLVLRRACHNPMVDRPDAFNRAVLDFLAGAEVGE